MLFLVYGIIICEQTAYFFFNIACIPVVNCLGVCAGICTLYIQAAIMDFMCPKVDLQRRFVIVMQILKEQLSELSDLHWTLDNYSRMTYCGICTCIYISKTPTCHCIYVCLCMLANAHALHTCHCICVYNVCMCFLTEWQEHGRISPASQVPECVFSEG